MFIVLLKFSDNRSAAPQFMDAHNDWLGRGFQDKVFLLAGSLQPGPGGGIVAHNVTPEELSRRVDEDPFVREGVVSAEIIELNPAKADERLQFLMD